MAELFAKIGETAQIQVTNLAMSRGSLELFAGLTTTIKTGDIFWLQGDNGIGKTTLLGALAGLHRADAGHIDWRTGAEPCNPSDIIAYQPHQSYAKPTLTVREDLAFWAGLHKTPQLIDAALDHVGLNDKTSVHAGKLSAGQKRRLALAKLIISQKPIWIMDEPSAAMDNMGSSLIDALILSHINRGGAAVIASHGQPQALSASSRKLTLQAAL